MSAYSIKYIKEEIINHLKAFTDGKATQDDIDWSQLYTQLALCEQMKIMDELHRQMQPYYEMYLSADPRLFAHKSNYCVTYIEKVAKKDKEFVHFAEAHNLISITESWADYMRRTDTDIVFYKQLLRLLLEGGYNTNWQELSETLKEYLFEAEVYSDYKTCEIMSFLHGTVMLMNTPWDAAKKMEDYDLLCENWEFLKHFYSVMIRRVIGCRLPNFSAVANLVAQQPKYHQYIHIFYCALCYRQDSLNLTRKQLKTLEGQMERIQNIMSNTKPSDALNELCDTLFPEDFQRMLEENRPETREQIEKERNRLKLQVGVLTEKMTEMANDLKRALENSVPIEEIEAQLLRLLPGAALDLCAKLTLMLSDNKAWMTSMPDIKKKILLKKEEQERQLAEVLQKLSEKQPVNVAVGAGGMAQITEREIINHPSGLLE